MRVLLLSPYGRTITGGVSSYIGGLTDALKKHDIEVAVGVLEGVDDPCTRVLGKSYLRSLTGSSGMIASLRPDVVHIHGHWVFLVPALVERALRRTQRVIFTFHTGPTTSGFRGAVLSILLNKADAVTAVSGDLLARVKRKYHLKTATSVTHPAVDGKSAVPMPSLRQRLSIPAHAPIILSIIPMHYTRKVDGLIDLIRSIPHVLSAFPDARLVVLGDGTQLSRVRDAIQSEGLSSQAHLLGGTADVGEALGTADIVCHISYQDELPLAVLESMAAGKAIICSPVGGLPEALAAGEEACFVSGPPSSIGAAIVDLLSKPAERERLGRQAHERWSRQFTWDAGVNGIRMLYDVPSRKRIHFTVDVEEDYLREAPAYEGVTQVVPQLLDIFRRASISASFFVTSDSASKFPDLVSRILSEGHHLGSHGLSHATPGLAGQTLETQGVQVVAALKSLAGKTTRPAAFRAPNFRVDRSTIDALVVAGVQIDSSIVPGRHVRGTRESPPIDFRGAPADPYRVAADDPCQIGTSVVIEVPVTSNPFARGSPLGLGYLNYAGADRCASAIERAMSRTVLFLIHPWEGLQYPREMRIPTWMRTGCQPNLNVLENFVKRLQRSHEIVSFSGILDRVIEQNSLTKT